MEKEILNFYNFFTFMLSLIQKKIKPNNQKLNKYHRLLFFSNKKFVTTITIYRKLFPYSCIYWESYINNLYFLREIPISFTLLFEDNFFQLSIINNQIYKCEWMTPNEINLNFSNTTCYTTRNIVNEIEKDQYECINVGKDPYFFKKYPYFVPLDKQSIQKIFHPDNDYKKKILSNVDQINKII